jgi:hypothetical protein
MIYQNATAQPRQELTDVIMEGTTDPSDFIALQVLPATPSKLLQAHVPKISIAKGDLLRATSKRRKPGSAYDRWQAAIDDHSITLLQVGEELPIPDEIQLTYEDYFPLESVFAMEAGNRLMRSLELDVSAAVMNASTFDAVNSAVAYTAANLATMTPVSDIQAAIRRCKARGERPNTIIFSGPVYDRVRISTDMKSFIAGTVNPGARVSPETIQQAFATSGIESVLVPDGYVNQSQATKNNDIEQIWLNTYVFVGKCKPGELKNGGIGRTFYWEKLGPILTASSYRDEKVSSNIIRGQKTTLSDITNARAGTLITTQYS